MPISTPTLVVANASSVDTTSYTIASATYTAGRAYVIFVAHAKTDPTVAPTISGTNSFTEVRSLTSVNRRLTMFTCKATSTVTETLTIQFSGVTQLACAWAVVEVASGFNAADPFGLDNGNEGSGTSGSVDVGTIPGDSVCIGAVAHYDFEGTNAGDTELADVAADTPAVALEVQYAAAGDDTISATWTTSGPWDFLIVEIQAVAVQNQELLPSVDSVDGSWTTDSGGTALAAALDASSTSYIQSNTTPSNSGCRVKLQSGADPGVNTGHVIHWAVAKTGTETINMTVKLYQGGGDSLGAGTLIASFTRNGVTSSFTTYDENLSEAQAGNITNYADLYLEFYANQV